MSPPKQHEAATARGGAQTPQGLPKCHEIASRRFLLNYSNSNRRCKAEKLAMRRRTHVGLGCATGATSANGVYFTFTVIAVADLLPWLVARRRLRR